MKEYLVKMNVKNLDKPPREGSTDTWEDRDIDIQVEAEDEVAAPAAALTEYYQVMGKTETELPRKARPRVRSVSLVGAEGEPAVTVVMVPSVEDSGGGAADPTDLDSTDAVADDLDGEDEDSLDDEDEDDDGDDDGDADDLDDESGDEDETPTV